MGLPPSGRFTAKKSPASTPAREASLIQGKVPNLSGVAG